MFERFWNWVSEEPSGEDLFAFAAKSLYVMLIYGLIIAILCALGLPAPVVNFKPPSVMSWHFAGLLLLGLFKEEFLFRFLPLIIVLNFSNKPRPIILIMLVSSVIFARSHGAWIDVFTQGVLGSILFVLFLKAGGLQKHFFKAFATAWIVHFLYDLILVSIDIFFSS